MFKSAKTFSAAVAAALTIAVNTPAFADSTGLSIVSAVAYFNEGTPQLQITLASGVVYYANTNSTCGTIWTPNVDTVKFWMSVAQAALLSGKTVNIDYQTCGPYKFITAVGMSS